MDTLITKLQSAYDEAMSVLTNSPHRDDVNELTGIVNNLNAQIDHANSVKARIEERNNQE